jgi:hypothetical protein
LKLVYDFPFLGGITGLVVFPREKFDLEEKMLHLVEYFLGYSSLGDDEVTLQE